MFKLISRTARNLVFRNRPYFAHFCVTHDCNLRCRYCQVWKEKSKTLGFEDTKRIIDRLDEMGIAILSLTGGEPLLRQDIYRIIDYAKSKGLYVRLTSNGTLSLDRYKKLLLTKIDAISISLDGVTGNDLPHSKISPKILNTLKFVSEHKGKTKLSISCLLHNQNERDIRKLIKYSKDNYANCRAFVQPVVVGTGKLRVSTEKKVDPSFLKSLDTLDPSFFIDACIKYKYQDKFDWNCQAGKLFFDIKPNGDFWICQDFPTGLNILSRDFLEQWKKSDFVRIRKKCMGCTYSCYYLTQKSFELKNWMSFIKTLSSFSIGNKK